MTRVSERPESRALRNEELNQNGARFKQLFAVGKYMEPRCGGKTLRRQRQGLRVALDTLRAGRSVTLAEAREQGNAPSASSRPL